MTPVDQEPDLSALAPVWVEALKREGLTSPVRVALWLDEHHGAPSAERVDMVLRRMRGEAGVMDLAAEQAVPHSRIQTMLRRTGMRLILPHLEEIAAWARAREGGLGDGAIAELAGTRPEVVSLALDGWPSRGRPLSDTQVVEAYTRWVSGAPMAEVANLLGSTPDRLRGDLADGRSSLPPRLQSRDLVARFGWNAATVTRNRQTGALPPPDGRDGLAYWWWTSTIDQWTRDREMHSCPSCSIVYPTETGLRGHLTRVH